MLDLEGLTEDLDGAGPEVDLPGDANLVGEIDHRLSSNDDLEATPADPDVLSQEEGHLPMQGIVSSMRQGRAEEHSCERTRCLDAHLHLGVVAERLHVAPRR